MQYMFRRGKMDKNIWVIFGKYYDSPKTWLKNLFKK